MSTKSRQQELVEALKGFDLSNKEIKVLLALLESGRAKAAHLANMVENISRTSVYDQLKALERKGLVSALVEGRSVFYQPENLAHAIDSLEDEKRVILDKQNSLRSVADLYEQLKTGTAYKPGVRTFRGKQGIRAVHRELQDARQELRAIGDLAAVLRAFPETRLEDNLKDFQTHKIPRWSLMVKNREAEEYLKVAPAGQFHTVKWLPKDAAVNTDTLLWKGHTAIIDYTMPMNAVVIDNPTIYETFLGWFKILWSKSEEIGK